MILPQEGIRRKMVAARYLLASQATLTILIAPVYWFFERVLHPPVALSISWTACAIGSSVFWMLSRRMPLTVLVGAVLLPLIAAAAPVIVDPARITLPHLILWAVDLAIVLTFAGPALFAVIFAGLSTEPTEDALIRVMRDGVICAGPEVLAGVEAMYRLEIYLDAFVVPPTFGILVEPGASEERVGRVVEAAGRRGRVTVISEEAGMPPADPR